MITGTTLTRRRYLAASGASVASAIAGCVGGPAGAEPPVSSVFTGTTFEGTDLVVTLADDHGVDRLNLIGPDGRLVVQSEVATGETKVGLQILDIKPLVAGFEHYDPGVHELVAVGDEVDESMSIDMRPELRIRDVYQYRDGNRPGDLGKLVVEVENIGTGPTWVYDVAYRNAPNFAANSDLSDDPGVIILEAPQDSLSTILYPGNSKGFVGITSPLEFIDIDHDSCYGSYNLDVHIGAPITSITTEIVAIVDGEKIASGLTGQFTCSDINVNSSHEVDFDA